VDLRLTRRAIAKALTRAGHRTSASAVNSWERHGKRPSERRCELLAPILRVSVPALLAMFSLDFGAQQKAREHKAKRNPAGTLRGLAAAILATALLTGCASMTRAEKACLAASVADVAATAVALEGSRGHEANPALTLAGGDAATVVVTSAIVTTGWMLAMRKMRKRWPETVRRLNWACAGLRGGAALANLDKTGED